MIELCILQGSIFVPKIKVKAGVSKWEKVSRI